MKRFSLRGTQLAVACVFACAMLPSTTHSADQHTEKLLRRFMDEFVSITPGEGKFPATFEMGCNDGSASERPKHLVKMSKPFSMAMYEVPQNLYSAVMGSNPSRWKGGRNSVEMINWDDANEFCGKITVLAKSEKLIGEDEVIRLPTEAEWEYCCRAGTTTKYSFGDAAQKEGEASPKASILNDYAWHTGNAKGNDPPVGALKPNPWGLYDMHGYLWEFTADAWTANYEKAPTDGSSAQTTDTKDVVVRSGSWKDESPFLTSFARRRFGRTEKDDAVGFRCVKSKRSN